MKRILSLLLVQALLLKWEAVFQTSLPASQAKALLMVKKEIAVI